jgi:Predicted ATPase
VHVVYEIGPFRLDSAAKVLLRSGVPEPLGARAVAVLLVLVRHANDYVLKQALLDAVWPGIVVEEANLGVQVAAIRRILGQANGGQHWIETLPRRGYRFVGPVCEHRGESKRSDGDNPTNLPVPLTSFIGRERELIEIKRELARRRLLSVVGTGGIGKTRLALQAANEVVGAYRDGVWFVDLARLADAKLVPNSIAQVLRVRESLSGPLIDGLCAYARTRQLLLVIDNCEHVLAACAAISETMLQRAPELSILATSREPLGNAAEQTYLLRPLSLPDGSETMHSMQRSEAIQLFVERARQRQPEFELTSENAPALAELCVRLDGIPLALELAAARVHAFSLEQINARLDDRFRLLTGGSRTALPRQQTLRATLDWSHALLTQRERTILRRLAVFIGGLTLEAAACVASDDAIDEFAVTDALSQLVARSLVVAEIDASGARYRQLETTRAYALEQLAAAGESSEIARRHAAYMVRLFSSAPEHWLRMSDRSWRGLYMPERFNLRAALEWAFGPGGDAVLGVRLAGASGPVWLEMSLHAEGRQRLELALERVVPSTPLLDQARLWLWLGMLFGDSMPNEGRIAKQRAVAFYRELGDRTGLGFSLVQSALALAQSGKLEEAATNLDDALPLLHDTGLIKSIARHAEVCGLLQIKRSNLANAREHLDRAFDLYREAGAEREANRMLTNLAELTWMLGDLQAAAESFRKVIVMLRDSSLTTTNMLGFGLCNLSGVLTGLGQLDEALLTAREGLPLLVAVGSGWIHADHFALRVALEGRLEDAAKLSGYADSQYAERQALRHPNEARARERLRSMLQGHFGTAALGRLLADGARLDDKEATRLALRAAGAPSESLASAPAHGQHE